MTKSSTIKKNYLWIVIPFLTFLLSLIVGRYFISVSDLSKSIVSKIFNVPVDIPEIVDTVIFNIRLPRIIVAMIVGASLSLSGAAYQGMFRNPMVSPDILGASQGASFGAALGILLGFGVLGVQFISFAFGIAAVFLTYFISKKVSKGIDTTLVLILSGIMVGTLFSSFVSLIKYVADPLNKLPAITFWLMGSLATISKDEILVVFIPFLVGSIPLMLFRWKLNILSFGEEEAMALGLNTEKIRLIIIISATLMTSSAISVCGLIGWVGLVVPHICRLMIGPDMKKIIPLSMIVGGTYLLIVDDLARTLLPIEIPLGILTAIIGAPFFIYLLNNNRRNYGYFRQSKTFI